MARTALVHACLTAVALGALAPVAHAGTGEVCILRATETRTAPRKPNIFETALDCGPETTAEQKALAADVNNAMNAAAALEVMVLAGYAVVASDWRDSFTGRQELGIYTLVHGARGPGMGGKGPKGPMGAKAGPALEDATEAPPADDAPVSEESSLSLPPAEPADGDELDDEAEAESLLGK